MSTSPMSQAGTPFYPRHASRSLPSSRPHSRSSSVESQPRGRTTYSHHRSPSPDSLYLCMDSSCGPIQRWDGLAREAIDWNSLRRDPELYLPVGNCLVFLYAAASSQRGPSFRIPYDLLLYSGCRPLIDRCLITSSASEYHPASSTPPSYDMVDDLRSTEENCCYLYLPAPAGLSRDESYVYHLTTRNFFAWLLGVPLVGTDPVSALLDLKIRMDMWRDPGSSNLGALFDYVKEQGYGDFEALEIEMGKRVNADINPAANPIAFTSHSSPRDEDRTSRRNSLSQRIRRKLSRSRTRDSNPPPPTGHGPTSVETGWPMSRMNSYTHGPSPPSIEHISAAMQRLVGPASGLSIDTVPNAQHGTEEKMKKRRSWTSFAGNAWKRASLTDVRLTSLHTQRTQQGAPSTTDGLLMSVPVAAQLLSSMPTSAPPEKRKRRLSWKRASMTDMKLLPLQTLKPQSVTGSATNRPPSAPGLVSAQSPQPTPASSSVPGEEKKKRRLSWANVSDKIFDIMMPPASKDDLPQPAPPSQGKDTSTSEPTELAATKAAVAAPSSPSAPAPAEVATALPPADATPASFPPTGRSATRSSFRHPSIHDFSTGKEICACCGKVRQSRSPSRSGPSQPPPTQVQNVQSGNKVRDPKVAFDTLHDHMKSRRTKFKSRNHKQIIVPDYGNGTIGLIRAAQNSKTISNNTEGFHAKTPTESKRRSSDAAKMEAKSVGAVASTPDAWRVNTQPPEKGVSVRSNFAPTEERTKNLKRLNALPDDAVVLSVKSLPETSITVPAGPMLAAELVASPTTLAGPSASQSSPNSSSGQECGSWSQATSLHHAECTVGALQPPVVQAATGKSRAVEAHAIPSEDATTREPITNARYESGSAQPSTYNPSQDQGADEDPFQIVDADFESNIEDLLTQLEAAGISEKETETGEEKQTSLLDLEPRIGMSKLVYEVA